VEAKDGGIAAANMKKLWSVLFFMDNSVSEGLIDAQGETVRHDWPLRPLNGVSDKALSN
jgi:hypothetical protein